MIDASREDVFVYLIDLPYNTKEAVSPNEDGSFSIFINARLSNAAQFQAYQHAMHHITNADFAKTEVQSIEAAAHNIIASSEARPIPAPKYLKEIQRIQRKRKRLQKMMKQDEERVRFLQEHCDVFALEEHRKLYGNDL